MTLTKLLELAKAGARVESAASESIRATLFRRELERRVSDGAACAWPRKGKETCK